MEHGASEVTAEGSPALPTTLTTWLSQNHTTSLLLCLRGSENVIVITSGQCQAINVGFKLYSGIESK